MSKIIKADQVALSRLPLAVPQSRSATARPVRTEPRRAESSRRAPARSEQEERAHKAAEAAQAALAAEAAERLAAAEARAVALVSDAQARAAEIVAAARTEAEAIIARAQAEAAEAVDEARTRGMAEGRAAGFEAGRAAGREAAMAEMQAALQTLARWVDATRRECQRRLQALTDEIAALALRAAERMLVRHLEGDSDLARRVVGELLVHARGSESVRVRVASADLEALQGARAALLGAAEGVRELEIVPDPALEPGSAILETEWGTIDGRWETRWGRLAESLGAVGSDAR